MKKETVAFIVPTGIGASIGGFAGDASKWARKFSKDFHFDIQGLIFHKSTLENQLVQLSH